ncbi:oxidoreductase [Paracoccus sp. (in: a-proteobacteria)]
MSLKRAAGLLGMIAACLLAVAPAFADLSAPPAGPVLLTIDGAITVRNAGSTLELDFDQLASLPQHEFATSTIWTVGRHRYQGVLLGDLIAAVGATGGTMTISALNDYRIELPVAEVAADGPLLAYLKDGRPMSVRERGPLWLLYPFDDNVAYRSELAYSRSIWQAVHIHFSD